MNSGNGRPVSLRAPWQEGHSNGAPFYTPGSGIPGILFGHGLVPFVVWGSDWIWKDLHLHAVHAAMEGDDFTLNFFLFCFTLEASGRQIASGPNVSTMDLC